MLRAAPILTRRMRDEAALHQARRPRCGTWTAADRAAVGRGARSRLSAHGSGHPRGYDGSPGAVSFLRFSADRALLLQSDTRSVVHGTRFGHRRADCASFMKILKFWVSIWACVFPWEGAGAAAAPADAAASTPGSQITLEEIMADPDWIGPAVRDEYWSADGR